MDYERVFQYDRPRDFSRMHNHYLHTPQLSGYPLAHATPVVHSALNGLLTL